MSRVLVAVSVLLTESEYRALRAEAPLMGEGTVAEVFRERAGLPPRPYGYIRTGVITENEWVQKAATTP